LESIFHGVDVGINARGVIDGVLGRHFHRDEELDACSVAVGATYERRFGLGKDVAEVVKNDGQHCGGRSGMRCRLEKGGDLGTERVELHAGQSRRGMRCNRKVKRAEILPFKELSHSLTEKYVMVNIVLGLKMAPVSVILLRTRVRIHVLPLNEIKCGRPAHPLLLNAIPYLFPCK
jgi:hypothetical protein